MADSEPTAPQLPDDLTWVGARGRPVLGDGRVGVVLFWSATSVHCERALAILAWLELCFARRPFLAVSVHVPRSEGERGTAFVERACARLGVRHAVAVDDDGRALAAFGGRSLPTLAVVDASGCLRFRGGGEPDRQRLTAAIGTLLDEAHAPPPPPPEAAWPPVCRLESTTLRFPTGVAIDEDAGLLWIADTGRHRLLAVDVEDGALRHVVGSGRPGATDGDFGYAAFASPRGLAAAHGRCYVADAGNHLVRRVDTGRHAVDTVLGQGRLVVDLAGGGAGASQGIAAPWDVELSGDDLYVALAGVHQVWQVTLGDGYGYAWAGIGHSGSSDGMRHDAAFAQPAAIACSCDELAIADADNGAVRIAGISTQHVHTASCGDVELEQPRGVAWHRADVVVADTLKNRILRLRVRDGTVEEIVGPDAGLCGPEGVAVLDDALFVADAGNHRVVRVDLASGAVEPFALHDPHPDHPEPGLPPIELRANARVRLAFPMSLPPDEHLHPDVPALARIRGAGGSPVVPSTTGAVETEGSWGTVRGVGTGDESDGAIDVVVRFATCQELEAEPHLQELVGRFDVRLRPEGPEVGDLHFG